MKISEYRQVQIVSKPHSEPQVELNCTRFSGFEAGISNAVLKYSWF